MTNLEYLNKEVQKKNFVMRSCWNCNSSHEHLKEGILNCFCGNWYLNGQLVTKEFLNEEYKPMI